MHDILEQLKKTSRQAQVLLKLLKKYQTFSEIPTENAYILEKQWDEIDKKVQDLPTGETRMELQQWLTDEQERITGYKEEFKLQFGQKLKSLFAESPYTVKGQYPLLRIGLYTLKVDFEFGQASIFYGPEIEKIVSRVPLEAMNVFKTIMGYDEALQNLGLTEDDMFKTLYEAYCRTLRLRMKNIGDKVLLTDVLREFVLLQQTKKFFADPQKSYFKEYSRVKMSFMFFRIKQSGFSERGWRLHVATFDATTDKLQSFWIPENEFGEGTHYSHISFEKKTPVDKP